VKSALTGLPVSRVMMTDFRALAPDDTLAHAIEHILSGCQQDFPVMDGGRVVGVLTRGDLLTGLAKQGQLAPVADVMQRNVCTAEASEMVESVLARVDEADCRVLPVLAGGELVGMLTTENLGEYMLIQAALGKASLARIFHRELKKEAAEASQRLVFNESNETAHHRFFFDRV
jgi:CBS domain-containing protein